MMEKSFMKRALGLNVSMTSWRIISIYIEIQSWWVQVSRQEIQALFKDFFNDIFADFKGIFSVDPGVSQ